MRLAARLHAIIRQRCPVCFQGAMFRGRFEMSATCPVCGHRFEREPGFFQGAMYVSYGIGIVYIGVLAILANAFLVPRIGVVPAAGCIIAIQLACVPAVLRYSRVVWERLNVGKIGALCARHEGPSSGIRTP